MTESQKVIKEEDYITRSDYIKLIGIVNQKIKFFQSQLNILTEKMNKLKNSYNTALNSINDSMKDLTLKSNNSSVPDQELKTLSFGIAQREKNNESKLRNLASSFKKEITALDVNIQDIRKKNTLYQTQINELQTKLENYYTTTSRIIDLKSMPHNERYELLNSKGEGIIKQLHIEGNNTSFNIKILTDDEIYIDKNYAYFNKYGNDLSNITAYIDNSSYILSIRNIQFQKKIQIIITATADIIFNNIFVNYDIRKERNEIIMQI